MIENRLPTENERIIADATTAEIRELQRRGKFRQMNGRQGQERLERDKTRANNLRQFLRGFGKTNQEE